MQKARTWHEKRLTMQPDQILIDTCWGVELRKSLCLLMTMIMMMTTMAEGAGMT